MLKVSRLKKRLSQSKSQISPTTTQLAPKEKLDKVTPHSSNQSALIMNPIVFCKIKKHVFSIQMIARPDIQEVMSPCLIHVLIKLQHLVRFGKDIKKTFA